MKKEIVKELKKKTMLKIVRNRAKVELEGEGDFTMWDCVKVNGETYDINYGIYGGDIFITAYETKLSDDSNADCLETNYDTEVSLV
jgi:hypothetical protein